MRRLRRLLAGSLVAAVLASGLGCGKKEEIIVGGGGNGESVNHKPSISEVVTIPTSIDSGDDCRFICRASDEDGDELSYYWESFTSPAGTFSSRRSNETFWSSPEGNRDDINYRFKVTVKDKHEEEDTKSFLLPVYTKLREFYSVKDAMVSEDYPDETIFANHDFLNPYLLIIGAAHSFHGEERIYLKFDLSDIVREEIDSATLYPLSCDGGGDIPGYMDAEAGFVTSSWTVNNLTWNNQPGIEHMDEWCYIPLGTEGRPRFSLDLTRYSRLWVENPSSNHGFVLMPAPWEDQGSRGFCSSRADDEYGLGYVSDPYLEVWLK